MAKKRVNGEGTIRKRSNGTWEVRVTVSVDPVTGKQHQKSLYGKNQKEVKAKLEEFLSNQAANQEESMLGIKEAEDDDLTLSEWLDIWLEDYLSDLKIGTLISYLLFVRLHEERIVRLYEENLSAFLLVFFCRHITCGQIVTFHEEHSFWKNHQLPV